MKSGLGQRLLLAGFALVIAGSYLTWRSLRAGPAPAGEVPCVTELHDDQPLPAFSLRGPKGAFTNANLRGRWSFVFFGYTQCPDICPTALTLMKEVKATLGGDGASPAAPAFQVVFVSVDPRRDTDALLDEYMRAFDASFIGVSGSDVELSPLTGALGVFFRRNDGTDKQRYTVDHTAAIYLTDPQGRLAAIFSSPQVAAKVAADYRRIARQ